MLSTRAGEVIASTASWGLKGDAQHTSIRLPPPGHIPSRKKEKRQLLYACIFLSSIRSEGGREGARRRGGNCDEPAPLWGKTESISKGGHRYNWIDAALLPLMPSAKYPVPTIYTRTHAHSHTHTKCYFWPQKPHNTSNSNSNPNPKPNQNLNKKHWKWRRSSINASRYSRTTLHYPPLLLVTRDSLQ